jgi:hypothetical protein
VYVMTSIVGFPFAACHNMYKYLYNSSLKFCGSTDFFSRSLPRNTLGYAPELA